MNTRVIDHVVFLSFCYFYDKYFVVQQPNSMTTLSFFLFLIFMRDMISQVLVILSQSQHSQLSL